MTKDAIKINRSQTIVCLVHELNPDFSLSEQSRERTDRAVNLYFSLAGDTITMSGGLYPKDAPWTLAEAMKRYAVVNGVDEIDIFKEEESLDTVGQAIFVKRDIAVPKSFEKFIVVSHDYHMPRVKTVFDFVYGNEFQISYFCVESVLNTPQKREREQKSIDSFKARCF